MDNIDFEKDEKNFTVYLGRIEKQVSRWIEKEFQKEIKKEIKRDLEQKERNY